MNENQVPVAAQVWIRQHEDELEYIQKEAERHPLFAALHLAELTEEYASKFDRDLLNDLTVIYGTAN